MSRHRMKNMGYNDDDLASDDGYDSADPEEQEYVEQCTAEVLGQLRTGEPAVTAARDEVQEALWHYYNDVDKAVGYLRNKKTKEVKKKQAPAPQSAATAKSKGSSVSGFPIPPSSPAAHFSAAEFFRDSPWLNVPPHRKADILVEPLYPRLGLLGGASEDGGGGGKVSKLAALAAARKKKEGDRASPAPASPVPKEGPAEAPAEVRASPLSLRERLSAASPKPKPAEGAQSPRGVDKTARPGHPEPQKQPTPEPGKPRDQPDAQMKQPSRDEVITQASEQPKANIRAPPSTFAATIVGDSTRPQMAEPSCLHSNAADLLKIYGQDLTEPFDFAGPSPDDVVANAQSSAKGFKSKQPSQKPADKKNAADLAGGVSNLSVEDKVNVKSKNLDVLSEFKKSKRKKAANFVVIGHVDAGKSTLMGRLLADLKAINQRTLDKYRQEAEKIGKGSFALAWVLDQGSEERARGVTIDIATNKFETENTMFTIVDAPGHRDFVPNMIAGASQADFAVLVIDSGVGNFEAGIKGQTKEHALLVRSMGVQKVIVAVNKMDAVQWSKDRFDEIEQQVSSFLTTAGFQAKNVSFIPCSGIRGDNITIRSEDPNVSWYTGHTLVEELETSERYSHALDKPLRMTIGDVFRGSVQNPLSISGRLDAGTIQVGDQILTMPSGETATIRSLEVDDEPSDWAVAGHNVVLNLANIDPIHLRSGDVICRPSSPIQNITSFKAKVLAFDHLTPSMIDIHRGRLHVPGRISKLVATLDKGSGAPVKKRPKIVPPGSVARIVVDMDQGVPLEAPTRIVLRAGGDTVAAGLLE
ncbi:Elongation factor [Aspergillus sp. HF37]|nr:Elongation factor [Aspergillus sp. HF37]